MSSRGATFLGTKRPREEHELGELGVQSPSSLVAEVGTNAAAQYHQGEHNSPQRHTPGVTPGTCGLDIPGVKLRFAVFCVVRAPCVARSRRPTSRGEC